MQPITSPATTTTERDGVVVSHAVEAGTQEQCAVDVVVRIAPWAGTQDQPAEDVVVRVAVNVAGMETQHVEGVVARSAQLG